jgi:peptide subunit release factor 1 (eRF1)
MKLRGIWKKQLLICAALFLALLLVGYVLRIGALVFVGILLIGASAAAAERGLRCPACRESVFKQAMERGAKEFPCPKCGEKLHME